MAWLRGILGLGFCLVILQGCTSVNRFDAPKVNLVSLKLLPRQGLEQPVLVGLRVFNPNKSALPIEGLGYRLRLNGHDLISGYRDQLPSVRARGDTYIELEARINLVAAAFELAQLLADDTSGLAYSFDADFDLSGLWPDMHVRSNGEVPLNR